MGDNIMSSSKTFGLPPGTLVHVGQRDTGKVKVSVIDYDSSSINERVLESPEEAFPFFKTPTSTWINVDGIHDIGRYAKLS
jgi:magnesium transporter